MSGKIPTSYLLIGGAAAAYFLFLKPKGVAPVTVINPATGVPYATGPYTTAPYATAPAVTPTASNPAGQPTTYGTPGPGYPSNYSVLTAANPNLLNPNYIMTDSELNQYKNNYLDVAQWAATYKKGVNAGLQKHWHDHGVAEKRVFVPIVPPSNSPYVPPQPNPNSSGGGNFLSTALTVVGSIAAILGPDDPKLNDLEIQVLFTGAGIVKDILPFYNSTNRQLVSAIGSRLDSVLNQYK